MVMKRLCVLMVTLSSMLLWSSYSFAADEPAVAAKKPNILIIWGDDIGQFNVSAYNQGVMGYRTPNIDSIAREGALFTDWYLAQHCDLVLTCEEQIFWKQLSQLLTEVATAPPQCFVHRDFHSCNLHQLDDGEVGIIDFQDAVAGPASYDLASWLWDRYIEWPRSDIEKWVEQARPCLAPQMAPDQWLRNCDFVGLQRNLKVVGIFARLHYRDGKAGYLDMLPQFAGYILDVVPRYQELKPYEPCLKRWLQACR